MIRADVGEIWNENVYLRILSNLIFTKHIIIPSDCVLCSVKPLFSEQSVRNKDLETQFKIRPGGS